MIYRGNGPEKDGGKGKGIVVLGHARITQVLQDMSKAEVINGRPDDIKALDRVIVQ